MVSGAGSIFSPWSVRTEKFLFLDFVGGQDGFLGSDDGLYVIVVRHRDDFG